MVLTGLACSSHVIAQSHADSVYLHAYTTPADNYHTGLHFEWSQDGATWFKVGYEHAFVKSDYGNWGSQKRMLQPQLLRLPDQTWKLLFRVGEDDPHIAVCTTPDLVHWRPQDYYPESKVLADLPAALRPAQGLTWNDQGTTLRVEQAVLEGLQAEVLRAQAATAQNAERAIDDPQRFAPLLAATQPQNLKTQISVSQQGSHPISDKLMGIFFEDISYAADGGLYAEMVQNRDFEYSPIDSRYRDPDWNATKAWSLRSAKDGSALNLMTDDKQPLHPNNPHYAMVTCTGDQKILSNEGWDGMSVKAGAKYDISLQLLLDNASVKPQPIRAALVSPSGDVLGSTTLRGGKRGGWTKLQSVIKATTDCPDAHLELTFDGAAMYFVDIISLFPQDTYKGRKNGMRRDLAEALEALHPRFIRFPGGCVAHGDGLDNLYRWKNTIGPLEARKPNWNIWRYHQTVGLGYYEYFQLCEDLGAQPLPVLAAGVPCQNSAVGDPANQYGQQGGIPLGPEMDAYIQDVLDLVEWANGDPKTSKWAKMRAEAGHPKPFGLKMIGIGNEDLISEVFEERFKLIYDAVRQKYPDLEVVGTVGPFYEGSDYDEGWRLARELSIPTVDEHYYNSPGWFINNQQYYDQYQRGGTKVYLGEYAAHIPGRANNIETALAEALYLCSVERNGDVVEMTSYAPLFARKGHTSWNPDLIYFDNNTVSPTTGYEVQRLFGVHSGTTWMPSTVDVTLPEPADPKAPRADLGDVQKRIGTSCLLDPATGDHIIKVVNYLPVANAVTIRLPFLPDAVLVSAEELCGELDAREVKTHDKDNVSVDGGIVTTTLAPYSFTVIRVH